MTVFPKCEYLLRAFDTAGVRRIVVSTDRIIVAADIPGHQDSDRTDLIGKPCHEVLFGRQTPCADCALEEAVKTGRPVTRRVGLAGEPPVNPILRHYLPVVEQETVSEVVIIDVDSPVFHDRGLTGQAHPGVFSQKADRFGSHSGGADAFLNNLIMSSADGVIASDLKGHILIFNEAASQISGYTNREALSDLDIRDIYPGDGAREIMRRLRSEDHGGRGKLKSYRTSIKHKDGSAVPINLSASIVYETGREIATVGFFYDLREKMRMEKELQEAQIQLMQAEKNGVPRQT